MDARELLDAYAGNVVKVRLIGGTDAVVCCDEVAPKAFAALRAVLERHHDDGHGFCSECSAGPRSEPHPCATVDDITAALEGK